VLRSPPRGAFVVRIVALTKTGARVVGTRRHKAVC
jgi:hypothetical protein